MSLLVASLSISFFHMPVFFFFFFPTHLTVGLQALPKMWLSQEAALLCVLSGSSSMKRVNSLHIQENTNCMGKQYFLINIILLFTNDKNRSVVTLALTVLTSSQAILIVWSKRAGKYEYSVTTANFLVSLDDNST